MKATEKALQLGSPILANIMLLGAAAGTRLLPLTEEGLAKAIGDYMSADKIATNLNAFRLGRDMVSCNGD